MHQAPVTIVHRVHMDSRAFCLSSFATSFLYKSYIFTLCDMKISLGDVK